MATHPTWIRIRLNCGGSDRRHAMGLQQTHEARTRQRYHEGAEALYAYRVTRLQGVLHVDEPQSCQGGRHNDHGQSTGRCQETCRIRDKSLPRTNRRWPIFLTRTSTMRIQLEHASYASAVGHAQRAKNPWRSVPVRSRGTIRALDRTAGKEAIGFPHQLAMRGSQLKQTL